MSKRATEQHAKQRGEQEPEQHRGKKQQQKDSRTTAQKKDMIREKRSKRTKGQCKIEKITQISEMRRTQQQRKKARRRKKDAASNEPNMRLLAFRMQRKRAALELLDSRRSAAKRASKASLSWALLALKEAENHCFSGKSTSRWPRLVGNLVESICLG